MWVGFRAGVGLVLGWFWFLWGTGLSFGMVGNGGLVGSLDCRYSLLGVSVVELR